MKRYVPMLPLVLALLSACSEDLPAGSGVSTPELTADLRQLREEEKLARDTYRALNDVQPVSAFTNISDSEQTHMDAVHGLLLAYSIEDPIVSDARGVFQSTELQTLYTDLVAQGSVSRERALWVGATVEELDIRDLRAMRGRTQEPDVLRVYDRLECGSRNHLRSFVGQLGSGFTPQYLSSSEVASILGGSRESCGG